MKTLRGPAIVMQYGDQPEEEATTAIIMRMIRSYVAEFNVVKAETFALIVFRHVQDANRIASQIGVEFVADDARYYPDTILP